MSENKGFEGKEAEAGDAPAEEAPPAAAAAPAAAASGTPKHLWGIGIVASLWNCMGCFDYLMTQTSNEAYTGNFSPELMEWVYAIPSWVHATWALGVWGGLLGSVLLLMRKSLSVPVFAVSVVGALITQCQNYFLAGALEVMGTGGAIFAVVIICVAVGLHLYARTMNQRGILS